jgi:hypothetical protein
MPSREGPFQLELQGGRQSGQGKITNRRPDFLRQGFQLQGPGLALVEAFSS